MISICPSSTLIWRLKFLAILLIGTASPAFAQETLAYKPLERHAGQERFMALLEITSASGWRIAESDLNNDGLPEIFLLSPDHMQHIYAVPRRKEPVLLAELPISKGLIVSDETDYGVRRLIVSGSETNDYLRRSYRWNPQEQRYQSAE